MIRKAAVSDSEDIARIHVETWRKAYEGIIPADYLHGLSIETRAERWAQMLAEESHGTKVALNENHEVIGWTRSGPSRDEDGEGAGELYAIYLCSKYWGKGIGRELMSDALHELLETGFNTVTLWVFADNKRTIRFYEKAGFKLDGAEKTIEISGRKLREVRYRLIQHFDR